MAIDELLGRLWESGYGVINTTSGQIIIIHQSELRPFGDDSPY